MNTANPQERIKALEAIIDRQMGIEDRYEELLLTARRCLRYTVPIKRDFIST